MGKKTKVGKQRKDKFYQLAKESGYRARSAFKLIQLNRKFGFLERARILVDLCAAPGGWMQVAQENMPMSSLVVGVDLAPIKALGRSSLSIQADITGDVCRRELEVATQGQAVDVVLHDGAPNVGQNWLQDAFTQAQLVLHALRLATKLLRKGGTFVTKIFRSKDHPALIVVFEKLFTSVNVTKPQASRNESAEIFAVCTGYLKPKAVDPALLDPKSVFRDLGLDSEAPALNILHPEKRKKGAEGYEDGDLTVYHSLPAREFVEKSNFVELLGRANEITLDDELRQDPLTTKEIAACLKDVQVLGRRELRLLINWRKAIRQKMDDEKAAKDPPKPAEPEPELNEEEKIQQELDASKQEERQNLRRKKRKENAEKTKRRKEVELEMVIPGDRPDYGETDEMFNLARVARMKSRINDGEDGGGSADEAERDEDGAEDGEEMELQEGAEELPSEDMVVDENTGLSNEAKTQRRTELWFQRAATNLPDLAADDDEDDAEFAQLLQKLKDRRTKDLAKETPADDAALSDDGEKAPASTAELPAATSAQPTAGAAAAAAAEEDEDWGSSSDDSDMEGVEGGRQRRRRGLDAEGLALGAKMLRSSKAERDIEEAGWNRYSHNDTDLPAWFMEDEKKHFRKPLPVDRALVEEMKKREESVGARAPKRLLEAKARKKKRELKKMEQTRKRAEAVVGSEELGGPEKAAALRKIYRQAKPKKEKVEYVVTKKGTASGRKVRRPPGVSGRFKVVDPRMKKDLRADKANARKAPKGPKGKAAKAKGGRGPKGRPKFGRNA